MKSILAKTCTSFVLAALIITHPVITTGEEREPASPKLNPGKALKKVTDILKKQGLSRLPPLSNSVRQYTGAARRRPPRFIPDQIVSGNPPTITEISQLDSIRELFWRPGIVDGIAGGTPSEDQCREFYSSNFDGESGGFSACFMAQGIGTAFQSLGFFESSLCHLKNVPTASIFKSGGIKLKKGKLPGNDITKIYSPGTKSKLILVNFEYPFLGASPERLYIKVPSLNQNKGAGRIYDAEVFFCAAPTGVSNGYNRLSLSTDGKLTITLVTQADQASGLWANRSTLTGYMQPSGSTLKWDLSKSRTSEVESYTNFENTDGYRSDITITPENFLVSKLLTSFSGNNYKNYSIAQFSGLDVSSLAFQQGGFHDQVQVEGEPYDYSGAFEFRDTYYATAPDNQLISNVQSFDLNGDPFYYNPINVDLDFTTVKCDANADFTFAVDQTNAKVIKALDSCTVPYNDNLYFCLNDQTVSRAETNYVNACIPPAE